MSDEHPDEGESTRRVDAIDPGTRGAPWLVDSGHDGQRTTTVGASRCDSTP
jgi:hypothetical protein